MKMKTREAIVGIIVYRVLRILARRMVRKGGNMASGKKAALIAAIGAAVGALLFWRKKKGRQAEQL
jgi:hypothetical protein